MEYIGSLAMYTWPYFNIKDTSTGEKGAWVLPMGNIWTDFGMKSISVFYKPYYPGNCNPIAYIISFWKSCSEHP